ncbi:hypothetical protein [Pseudolactococcus yaeyamensis]
MTTLTFKKTLTIFVATGFAVALAACRTDNNAETQKKKKRNASQETATITLDFENDKKIDETKQSQSTTVKVCLMLSKIILRLKKKVGSLHQLMVR